MFVVTALGRKFNPRTIDNYFYYCAQDPAALGQLRFLDNFFDYCKLDSNSLAFTVLYCTQDPLALRLDRKADANAFYCQHDTDSFARKADANSFYCSQDVSIFRNNRVVTANIAYCQQDVVQMTISTVTINTIATDNIVQPPEEKNLIISGKVSNVYDNTTANIIVNNITYTTSVFSNIFSVNIPVTDIASWDTTETVTVSVVKGGVTYSASTTISFGLTELFFTPQKLI